MKIVVKIFETIRNVLKTVETIINFFQDSQKKSKDTDEEESESHTVKMSADEFATKVEWEGGIMSALEYGMTYTDLEDQDSELAKLWKELEEEMARLKPKRDRIQTLLDESWGIS